MSTPVSGPGQFSKRTDKAVENANLSTPNADYGEAKAMREQRQGAPVASNDMQNFLSSLANSQVVGLDQPSNRPDTPVTDGAAMGAGVGVDALGIPDQKEVDLQNLIPALPVLEFMANQPGASWFMRNKVRQLKSRL